MAEQATKEPTMEEILASIRRIISEGGEPEGEAVEAASTDFSAEEPGFGAGSDDEFDVSELLGQNETPAAQNENDHLLSVDELLSNDDLDYSEIGDLTDLDAAAVSAPQLSEDPSPEPMVELDDAFMDSTQDIDDLLGVADEVELSSPEPVTHAEPEPTPAPAPDMEADMAQTSTAPAPASSFGMAALSAGSGNTIEGLVAELMTPMIKEWIDTNLPTMVESRVEAEIQQIANKVIAALRD